MRLNTVAQLATACAAWASAGLGLADGMEKARLAVELEAAGFHSVRTEWQAAQVDVSAEAPGYKDPLVALAVMGTIAARVAPGVAKMVLQVREGPRTIIEMTTTPGRLPAFLALRLSEAQRKAVEEALVHTEPEAAGPDASARTGEPSPEPQPPAESPARGQPAETNPGPPATDEADPPSGALAEPADERAVPAQRLQGQLVRLGLENVRVTVRASGIVVEYENRVFRNELTALGVVLGAAAEAAQPKAEIVAVPKRRDVPVIAVIAGADQMRRFMQGESLPGGLRGMMRVSQDVRRFTRRQAGDEETRAANRSRGRLDLTAEPHLNYGLGQTEDPFWADVLLQPGAEVQLSRGMLAGVRGDVILDRGEAHWDHAYVSHVMRPGHGRLVLASTVGQVAPRLGAWHGEGLLASDDDRLRFGASFTLLGRHLFDLDAGVHSRSALGMAEYEVQPLDLTLRASGGRFLFGDEGGRLDIVRRFGERELTLTTIYTDLGDRWAFSLRLPLGPAKLPPPRCGRLRWAEDWEVGYHSTIVDLGETIDYDFSLASFRDELSGPYLLAHPEELRRGVPALRRAGILRADAPTRAAREQTTPPQQPPWPSLLGRSGLVFIPTADTLGDGQYAFGASFIDRRHTILHERAGGRTASVPPFVGFAFLPGVEIGMRYTIYPSLHAYDWGYSTNRAPYAHVRLLRERGRRPGVAGFVEDLTGASVEKAYGLAVSEHFAGAEWTAGCGEGRFDGLFGGVSRPVGSRGRVMAEYDSRFVNLGAGARLDHFLVQGALLGFDGAACGVSFWGRF